MKQSTLAAGKGWKTVTPPTGWTWTLPFVIKQKGRKFKVIGWKVDAAKPTGKAYYVSTTGSDANDGSAIDDAHALRNIRTAALKADVVMVYVKAGLYGKSYTNIASSRSISLIAVGGRVTAGAFFDTLTWTADGAAYTAALSSGNTYLVTDASRIDAKGDFAILTKKTTTALVQANPGSWYCDGTNVWVRTTDDRIPDSSIRIYDKSFYPCALGLAGAGNGTFYVEGFDFEGGYHAFYGNGQTKAGNTAYLKNCTAKYASQSGFANTGETMYLVGCTAALNAQDAFTAHISGTIIPKQAVINCIGRDSVGSSDSNNGSTSHEGSDLLNIQSEFYNTAGPVVHTVDNDSKTWCLGVKSHHSRATTAASKVGFMAGTMPTGDTTILWLDCCEGASNTGGDLRSNVGNTLNYRKFKGDLTNAGAGTVAAY